MISETFALEKMVEERVNVVDKTTFMEIGLTEAGYVCEMRRHGRES